MKDRLYWVRGGAGIGVTATWELQRPWPGTSVAFVESWFCSRSGGVCRVQRIQLSPQGAGVLAGEDPPTVALEMAKRWIDAQAWLVLPDQGQLSDGLESPLEDPERISFELFRLGVEAPALLDALATTSKNDGLKECVTKAKLIRDRVKVEELEVSEKASCEARSSSAQ